ncbi:MAG TPA: glycosyltransferase family 2 protein [Frateuria sp.]|uniref:glycosyltransferase family 2 protein n=1 Tax=Frateuria sp. TaxID=2211372 RepID=UPI002D7EC854|nr:glycosyltransferase family 2 protein [Frateuria sp.]HET6807302.1 glycosyltransferase family 2 protein [Frateuria sp.]
MAEPSTSQVCAVVITYRPDPEALRALLAAVRGQVGATVVVDNSGPEHVLPIEASEPAVGAVLRQARNIGLAQAQNLGIDWARRHGYRNVLLLDQDSLPGEGMVQALLDAIGRLGAVSPVAAVGPRFHDLREARDAPFVRLGFPFNRKLWCRPDQPTIECDFLISSGALLPMAVLDDVGDMDAGLFIDNVDLEWGFRARAKGYTLHGVCAATMHHRLGDARMPLPLGLGQVTVHGPGRLYYMMRNRVRLYRMPHTPRVWVAQDLPRVAVKLFLFGVLVAPRGRNLRFMLRGLWDGWRGRQGPCPLVPAH